MITSGVAAASGSVTTSSLFRPPPGPATLLLANAGTAATIFVGAGTNVTTSNGFPVPLTATSPVVVPIYAGSPQQTWSCITAAGSATLSWIYTDATGGTGTGNLG